MVHMVGYKHANAGDPAASADAGSGKAAPPDEICADRRYEHDGRVLAKAEQRLDEQLESVIDGEIVPRLMLLYKAPGQPDDGLADQPARIDLTAHVEEFSHLVLHHDDDRLIAYVRELLQRGVTLEDLLLHLLAPTARALGKMWERDTIDFVDVTIGTSRLQQILHRLTWRKAEPRAQPGRRVLLLPTPTEQHTFGLLMVSQFFRQDGWEVWGGAPLSLEEISAMVADHWFALVGFSLSSERLIDTLCSTIKAVRGFSINQSVQIAIGGRMCAEDEALKHRVGADMVATDARQAIEVAETIFHASPAMPD